MPKAWRGAALQYRSSIGWQQAAPGNVSAQCLPIASVLLRGYNGLIELPHLETFPGAACC
jgi:hypothetical protein